MNTIENELSRNGIQVICPIDANSINAIADYVANALCSNFPELNLNHKTLYENIVSMKMYIAEMPENSSGACYLYMNESIYFRKGLSLVTIKKLAIHECIHHFQEIKDKNGKLRRMGLCTYARNRAYGNALNEASVQLMSAYAMGEKRDTVKYYGMDLPTDSPTYYPLLCNLIKQIGYITSFDSLFESTFYSNDIFFHKFKEIMGENKALKIQKNFEKIVYLEEKIISNNAKIQTEELEYDKFKKTTDSTQKCKDEIQKTFLSTQNLIIKTFFDVQLVKIENTVQIEDYRKYLYSFSNLIATTPTYTFFNDYYINQMTHLDAMYEKFTGTSTSKEIAVVKKSKIFAMFEAIRKFFTKETAKDFAEDQTNVK